jgi:hypothetical protein
MTEQDALWFGDTAMLACDTVIAELVRKNIATQEQRAELTRRLLPANRA